MARPALSTACNLGKSRASASPGKFTKECASAARVAQSLRLRKNEWHPVTPRRRPIDAEKLKASNDLTCEPARAGRGAPARRQPARKAQRGADDARLRMLAGGMFISNSGK
jgi:hypothetical protein